MGSENGLAYIGLSANTPDSRRAQLLDRSKTTTVKTLHRLFVDQTETVQVAGILMRFCEGSVRVGLCHIVLLLSWLTKFLKGSVTFRDVDFAVRESQVTLCKVPVDFEFLGTDIFHVFLFPAEHQERAVAHFQRHQCPSAAAGAFSGPGDSELVEPSAKVGVWRRK